MLRLPSFEIHPYLLIISALSVSGYNLLYHLPSITPSSSVSICPCLDKTLVHGVFLLDKDNRSNRSTCGENLNVVLMLCLPLKQQIGSD